MATQLQNRLVGTVILVALGVIFLPDLLDGQKERHQEPITAIPLHPELEPPRPSREYREPEALVEYDRRLAAAGGEGGEAIAKVTEPGDETALPSEPVAEVVSISSNDTPPVAQPSEGRAAPAEKAPAPAEKVAAPVPAAEVARATPKAEPTTDHTILADVKDNAWVIRLGTFKNAANVSRLIARLRAAGYPAYSRPVKPIDGELNRVYVGPNVDKSRLEGQLGKLKRLTDLNGRVYPFNPLND